MNVLTRAERREAELEAAIRRAFELGKRVAVKQAVELLAPELLGELEEVQARDAPSGCRQPRRGLPRPR